MVKSKKMSKTSIAIIVLALLLVLSMVLGLTGAWFTDYVTGSTSKSINFGNIDIDAGVTAIADGDWAVALPGDGANLAGSVTVKANSENMYVLVTPSKALLQGQNALALYYDKDGDNGNTAHPIMTITFADGTVPATWKLVESYTEGKLYYVAKTNQDKVLPLVGRVEIDSNVTNVVYDAEGTAVRLNVDDPSLGFSMQIGVEAKAVQARHVLGDSVTADEKISKTQAEAIVAAMSTLPAQAA